MTRRFGIIIPAWNCGQSIARSLESLVHQQLTPAALADIHVVVAVNDSLETSIRAAETFRAPLEQRGFRFDVITSPRGRRMAIIAAEALLSSGPRLYLDQDARLSNGAIGSLHTLLTGTSRPVFATLSLKFTCSRSPPVRAFLRSWRHFPYVRRSPVVAGAFAVSAAGRARWNVLPSLQADDKFVRLLFDPGERVCIDTEAYEVLAPDTFREHLQARLRYRRANHELGRFMLSRPQASDVSRHAIDWAHLIQPRHWGDLLVFSVTWVLVVLADLLTRAMPRRVA